MDDIKITHNTEQNTFEVVISGHRAFVEYQIYDHSLDIRKTLVPKELGGKGLAGKIVKAAYDYAQEQGLKCIATCSYAVVFLEKHPEYNGHASEDYVEGSCAVGKHK